MVVRHRLSFKENGVATTCAFTDTENRSFSLPGPATAAEPPRDSARLIDGFYTCIAVSARMQTHAHRQRSRRAGGDWTLHTGSTSADCELAAQAARLMCDQKLSDGSVMAARARRESTIGEHKSADRPLCEGAAHTSFCPPYRLDAVLNRVSMPGLAATDRQAQKERPAALIAPADTLPAPWCASGILLTGPGWLAYLCCTSSHPTA